ncbi:MAG: glycosyltransferase family 4 protein [Methylacidiphilales bacterium]|nr:glycosyltransferase family 4 protein [Candidatus Methylacidiphilales bacterium]
MLPWIRTLLDKRFKIWLDLDELESSTLERLATLFLKLGQDEMSRRLQREAEIYRALEKSYLPRFEYIVTASDIESRRLRDRFGGLSVETWPNLISLPVHENHREQKERAESRILFIGNMGYFPNLDAVRYAAGEVLPRVQRLLGRRPVIFQVAGSEAEAHRAEFARMNQVEWLGTVGDLTPFYAEADIVIAPLRSGGGTRIKILEAFAHRKAVVSTRLGAEGLNVLHGRELLLADEPEELAAACAELLLDAERRARLAAAGYAYVTIHHGQDNLKPRVTDLARAWSRQELAEKKALF